MRKIEDIMLPTPEEIRKYCKERGYKFCPEITDELPNYAKWIDMFIRERAKRDLPKSQLEGTRNGNAEDYLEMAGLLKIRGDEVAEISYTHPKDSRVEVRNGKVISYGGTPFFPINYFEQGGDAVDYHSHPDGDTNLSASDVEKFATTAMCMEMLKDMGGKGKLFFAIHQPNTGKSVWYASQELNREK
ncbi:MAG: hypothetical protein PHH00_04385 [Candidatus Nanoarchaeia archaeon]|nr:hypothetical protein [Candidatus Nanoarchaeia archaeon]